MRHKIVSIVKNRLIIHPTQLNEIDLNRFNRFYCINDVQYFCPPLYVYNYCPYICVSLKLNSLVLFALPRQ